MAETITIPAQEVWDYFFSHQAILKEKMHRIAENKDYGTEIYLTEQNGFPYILVYADNNEVKSVSVWEEQHCFDEVKEIYEKYLTKEFIEDVFETMDEEMYSEEMGYEDYSVEDEYIEDRESTLDWAFANLIDAVLEDGEEIDSALASEITDDVKEHVLEYIALKYGIDIYRPMWIQYDDGEEEYEEYPYDKLAFDDEDNPIYAR